MFASQNLPRGRVSLEQQLFDAPLLECCWWMGATSDWAETEPCIALMEDVSGLCWDGSAFQYPWHYWLAESSD